MARPLGFEGFIFGDYFRGVISCVGITAKEATSRYLRCVHSKTAERRNVFSDRSILRRNNYCDIQRILRIQLFYKDIIWNRTVLYRILL